MPTMAPMPGTKLTLVPTIAAKTDAYDFVSPQASLDQEKIHEMEDLRTWILRQTSSSTQSLTSSSDTTSNYTIKSKQTGGLMNRKPHMTITRQNGGSKYDLAEVRFEINGSGTNILYIDSGITQPLSLYSSLDQRYECPIQGELHWWQPLGPSRSVLESTNSRKKRIALFVYSTEVALTTGFGTGKKKLGVNEDIGKLHILEDIEGGAMATEQVLCTALTVIERAKRRAANVGRQGSAYKQGASCGITSNAYGGGL